jgi:hypothetical protein
VTNRLDVVVSNGLLGLALVTLMPSLFLKSRPSWATTSPSDRSDPSATGRLAALPTFRQHGCSSQPPAVAEFSL